MKISKERLKEIIKEELQEADDGMRDSTSFDNKGAQGRPKKVRKMPASAAEKILDELRLLIINDAENEDAKLTRYKLKELWKKHTARLKDMDPGVLGFRDE